MAQIASNAEDVCKGEKKVRYKFSSPKTVIYSVLEERPGWRLTDSETDWDFHWCEREWMVDMFDKIRFRLKTTQRVNHFRNSRELSRKDLLAKNIQRQMKTVAKTDKEEALTYDFIPKTFVLPREYALFVEEFNKLSKLSEPNLWIMKPIGRSQGRGIFVFRKLSDVSKWKFDFKPGNLNDTEENEVEHYVVQRYLKSPLLIGGKKFDLRLYVLVSSFQPLKIWLHRGGFGRFSNDRFSLSDIKNNNVHLTNISIQKRGDNYDRSTGAKWDIHSIKQYLMTKYGESRVLSLFGRIEDIIVKSILSVKNVMMQDKRCFELFGYDIIIDSDLKPWLLEVNSSPALAGTMQKDFDFKFDMLSSVLDIIDVEGNLSGNEIRVGGFDCIYNNTRVEVDTNFLVKSMLGCKIIPGRSEKTPHRQFCKKEDLQAATKTASKLPAWK